METRQHPKRTKRTRVLLFFTCLREIMFASVVGLVGSKDENEQRPVGEDGGESFRVAAQRISGNSLTIFLDLFQLTIVQPPPQTEERTGRVTDGRCLPSNNKRRIAAGSNAHSSVFLLATRHVIITSHPTTSMPA